MTDSDKLDTVNRLLDGTPQQWVDVRRYLIGSASVAGAAAGVLMALFALLKALESEGN